MSEVITRFAPSPTGHFHIGGVRSALYNYLYARSTSGKFILRSEDTDPERSKKEYEDEFLAVFKWLGLEHDEFFRQSDRKEIYKKYLEDLIARDVAYISKEEVKEEGQRSEVIRLRNSGKDITFNDIILGDITFNTKELGDFIIARDIESPLYHFTVVVDDMEMKITHVIRGQEHISNTPRQILIQEAIGATRPLYAHIPLILGKDKSKLSKRDPEVIPAIEYKDQGYLPEAILNFMALIGWNPGTDEEVFIKDALVSQFKLEKVQKGGGVFNIEKLNWINKEHLKKLTEQQRGEYVKKFIPSDFAEKNAKYLEKIIPVIFERISNGIEIKELIESGEFNFLSPDLSIEKDILNWNGKQDSSVTLKHLNSLVEILENINDYNADVIKNAVMQYADKEEKRGAVLHPMRYALSGQEKSPDPFTIAGVLGKEDSIKRLKNSLTVLN